MSRRKKPLIKALEVTSIGAEGKAIARHEGKVIFLQEAVPGDVVDVQITRKKASFMEGYPTAYHSYSKDRIEPFCSHFGVCGGCKWQHLGYEQQLAYKEQQVVDQLSRIGHVDLPEVTPILGAASTQYYRNKLEFTFSDKRWLTKEQVASGEDFDRDALGFHIPRHFDKVVKIDHCYLQPDPSNAIRTAVDAFAKAEGYTYYNHRDHAGDLRNLIIRTANTGQYMIILQFGHIKSQERIDAFMAHLAEQFPDCTSLNYIINTKGNETFHDLDVHCVKGTPYIIEEMTAAPGKVLQYRVGPKSFFQTNSAQAQKLYELARDLAEIKPEDVVYDLYTGTGTIANFVAHQAQKVVGLEYVPEAIEDAKVNSDINGIGNTQFYAGDIKDLLTRDFLEAHDMPDVIITDPPRAGMHADVVNMLLQTGARRIVYVSCNPATQARDLALLDSHYAVTAVQPVDMFPQTYHVENIVALDLRPQPKS